MKLIVGLGNPGREYENTRHNIGFMMIDSYVQKKELGSFKEKDRGLFLKAKVGDEDVIFLKPLSYMNLSGEVVKRYVQFYKIEIMDILVISDDLDLEIGNFKLKSSGSSGGHNGLKNLKHNLSYLNLFDWKFQSSIFYTDSFLNVVLYFLNHYALRYFQMILI